MYLGRERHDRTVALVLAAALVAVAVLGLVVTLTSAGAGATGDSGAAAAAPTATAPPSPAAPEVHAHGEQPPVDPGDGPLGHPWRLVGMLAAVVLLFGCGVLITHEVRRRADDAGSNGGPGEWIS